MCHNRFYDDMSYKCVQHIDTLHVMSIIAFKLFCVPDRACNVSRLCKMLPMPLIYAPGTVGNDNEKINNTK